MFARIRNSELVRVLSLLGSRQWGYILGILVDVVTEALCFNTVLGLILRDMLNAAVSGARVPMIRALATALGTFLVGVPVLCITRYWRALCVKKTLTEIRTNVFEHLVDLPVSRFERQHSGDVISRCTNDLNLLENIYAEHIWSLAFALVLGLIALVSAFILEWRISLVVVLLGVITTLTSAAFTRPLQHTSQMIQAHTGTLTERLTDLLQSLAVTKIFHLEQTIHHTYTQENQGLSTVILEHARIDACSGVIGYVLDTFRIIGLPALGLLMVMKGSLEAGTVIALFYFHGHASYMFGSVGRFITDIQRSLAGAKRVFELLDSPVESQQHLTPGCRRIAHTQWSGPHPQR